MNIYEVFNRDGFYTYRLGKDEALCQNKGWCYRLILSATNVIEAENRLKEILAFEETVISSGFFFREVSQLERLGF